MQVDKITKSSIKMFFTNPDLVLIKEYLSYKSKDKTGFRSGQDFGRLEDSRFILLTL